MLENFQSVFLVYERNTFSVDDMVKSVCHGTRLDIGNLVTIMYNALCALNFLHSADLAHRNISSTTLFVDGTCQVYLNTLEYVRVLPEGFESRNGTQSLRKIIDEYMNNDEKKEIESENLNISPFDVPNYLSIDVAGRENNKKAIESNMVKILQPSKMDKLVSLKR